MADTKIDIWIIEDDQELREGYTTIVNSSDKYFCSESFRSVEDAMKALKKGGRPLIVLMDVELPGMNGVEGTNIIKGKYPEIVVIMVTVYDDSELVFNSLKAGASGYITKSSNYLQLLEVIDEIMSGGAPMSSRIAKMVVESFHTNHNSPLSKREAQILRAVASGKTFTQISNDLFIARETTKTHIRNIYEKLEVNCRAEAIAKANKEHLI